MWSVGCGYKTMKKLNCHTARVRFHLFVIFTVLSGTKGEASLSDCRVDIDTDWTVRGSCHYTKADVSKLKDINCTWYRQLNQGPVTLVTDGIVTGQLITEGSKTFYSGNCSFRVTVLTSEKGTHTFYIDFMPGPERTTMGQIKIVEPGMPETNCTNIKVFPEGQDGSCDCTNNRTQPGSPPPTVRWRVLAPGQPLLLQNMLRSPIETRWICMMRWGPVGNSVVKTTYLTTVIVYGPDRITISDWPLPLTGVQDLNEGQTAVWSCTAYSVSHTVQLQWTGVQCDDGQRGRDCRFTAGRQDDGKTVTCTGTNVRFPDVLHANTSVKLNVKYPPTTPPEITGYINNTELTEGDNLTLTCTVRGGNPPVSSVTFSCGTDHHDNPNDTVVNSALHNDSSVSSTVTIQHLQAGDNGTTCLCGAQWPFGPATLNYNLTSSVTLRVNGSLRNVSYPPTTPPEITGYINNTELTEGDNVTLTCTVRGGNPPVSSVNFSCGSDHHDNPNDTVVNSALHNDSSVSSTVTILNLQSGDDGTTCVCEAEWPYGPASLNYNLTSSVTLRVNATIMAGTESTSTLRTQQQTNGPAQGTNSGEKINVGAVVGGGVGAVVVIVTVVVVVVFVKRYMGRSIYAKPGPRLEESNYTDLVVNEPGGETNRASSHENKAADHDYENSGDKRTPGDDVQYENTGSASQTAELNQYANSEVYAVSRGAHVYQNTGAVSHTCAEGVYEDTSQM